MRVLSLEEVKKLLLNLPQRTSLERKHRLMILILYGLGVRTGELCRLNFQDIDLDKRQAYIFRGKNDINRYIPIPSGVYVELAIYLKSHRRRTGPLFLTDHKGKRVTVGYIGRLVRDLASKLGLEDVTPKVFRHTFASHLIEQKVPIEVLSSLMGHKTPRETGVYLHSTEFSRKESVHHLNEILAKEEL